MDMDHGNVTLDGLKQASQEIVYTDKYVIYEIFEAFSFYFN